MSGFNVVRYTVKDGMEEAFLKAHEAIDIGLPHFHRGHLIKTGERQYCFIGEWDSARDSMAAEDQLVAFLDAFRDTLEDKGDGQGVTDFVVGDEVIAYPHH